MRGVQSCVTGLVLTLDWGKQETRTAMGGPVSFPVLLQWDPAHPQALEGKHLGRFHC